MKLLTILLLLFFCVCSGIDLYAQDETFYIQIEDVKLIPEIIKKQDSETLEIRSQNQDFSAITDKYKIKKFEQAFPTAATPWLKKVFIVKCNDRNLGEELKSKFREKIPLVEYLCEPVLTYTPNDYGLAIAQTNLDLINAKEAWDICKDFPKINVAITDTNFELNHEDLNIIGTRGSSNPYDYHGIAVAGCVGAVTDNGIGLASVGFNSGVFVSTYWASDNEVLLLAQSGYRVINCSWINGCTYSTVQNAVYEEIRNTWNTVVVFGAGNRASSNHCGQAYNPVYPASYSSNISVTSVGHINVYGTQGSPSNNWKDVHEEVIGDSTTTHHHHPTIDICAPGYNVPTTDIMGANGINSGNYAGVWGTSFAAPQVSATLGLIFSINPCLSSNQGVSALLNNTDNSIYNISENSRYLGRLGSGRLNVSAAVNAAAESATIYLQNQTLTGSQNIESNYAIRAIGNVTVPSGANINLITRKEVTLNGAFEVAVGAEFSVNVNINNVINCN